MGDPVEWRRRRQRAFGCLALVILAVAVALAVLSTQWLVNLGVLILLTIAIGILARLAVRSGRDAVVVDELVDAATRVQEGDFSARVPETGPDDQRMLARAFNQMSEQLGQSDIRRRSFMADVSHELRTPLAVIQGQLEAIRDGVYPG